MMRPWVLLGMATALQALSAGAAHAQLRVPGQPPNSVPAQLLVDLAPLEGGAREGELKRNAIIAEHRLVARDAVVLDAVVKGKVRDLSPGLVLARVEFAGTADTGVAWCDTRPMGLFSMGNVDCLVDTDGDKRFDRLYTGSTGGDYFPFRLARVADMESTPLPLPFHPASPEQRPQTRVGYKYCDGDGVASPPRFAAAVIVLKDDWSTGDYTCPFGVWSDAADHQRVTVDGVELKITPGERPGTLRYLIVEDLPAGPVGPLDPGGSIVAALKAQTAEAKAQAAVKELTQPLLRATGPAVVAGGVVQKGDPVVTLPVAHGITGVLQNRVKGLGLFAIGAPLEVGQPVYGVPMSKGEIVWCAPRSTLKGETRKWSTICLPAGGGVNRWLNAFPPLLVTSLSWVGSTSAANAPSVQRQVVDFKANMKLEYRFSGWKSDHAIISLYVTAEDGSSYLSTWRVPRTPGGDAMLSAAGGVFKLTPGDNDHSAIIETVTAPKVDASVAL
jgi:hypothetical protein